MLRANERTKRRGGLNEALDTARGGCGRVGGARSSPDDHSAAETLIYPPQVRNTRETVSFLLSSFRITTVGCKEQRTQRRRRRGKT